jgi:hypothetical protein
MSGKTTDEANMLASLGAARWSWRCFFGIHRWQKWSEPTVTTSSQFAGGTKEFRAQHRSCVNCNRRQTRALMIQMELV